MYKIVEQSLEVCDPKYFWINPDCGLKTRRTEEVIPALEHMVQAAKDAVPFKTTHNKNGLSFFRITHFYSYFQKEFILYFI